MERRRDLDEAGQDLTATETGAGALQLQGLFGPVIKRAHVRLQSATARALEPLGLRVATFSALSVICDRPGLRLSTLADLLGAERSNTQVAVEALDQEGLVTRRREAEDKRAFALHATAEGHALCRRAIAEVVTLEAALLASLSQRERDRLHVLLERAVPLEETAPRA